VWVLESKHTDTRTAGRGSEEVHCVQCAGGRRAETRSVGQMRRKSGAMMTGTDNDVDVGIKEYSEWPTIPQLYVDKEFVGGCDILASMHQNGELAKMLEEKGVLVEAEG